MGRISIFWMVMVSSPAKCRKYEIAPGLVTTDGQLEESNLAAPMFLRGLNGGATFILGSNVDGDGAMDDIFRFVDDDEVLQSVGEVCDKVFSGQRRVNDLRAEIKDKLRKASEETVRGVDVGMQRDGFPLHVKAWCESSNDILHDGHDILLWTLDKARLVLTFEEVTLRTTLTARFPLVFAAASSSSLSFTKLVQILEGLSFNLGCKRLPLDEGCVAVRAKGTMGLCKDYRQAASMEGAEGALRGYSGLVGYLLRSFDAEREGMSKLGHIDVVDMGRSALDVARKGCWRVIKDYCAMLVGK